ncbi:glycerol-3-phosphate cytidylyltransferase [Pseudoalteromonas translucida KMM 520]|uniref:Glycerol-3-phosphate cytidylyltransferase n=1 Tax=Pseudoalteromonas translucida KMM 520 TaxID=1315283 RepID=A0A0U2V1T5_9GAMM|nr:glycerol-3-phosphate cytidylyltransferase [Pseudoalteromonas translucida KMM 520]
MRLLKRLSQLGDQLIVGISSDEFNLLKGKSSFFSYEERAEIVESCKYVSSVFPEHDWQQKREDIVKYDADIFAMGDDWKGKFDDLFDLCEVVYLTRTEDVSTTKIKKSLSKIDVEELDRIESSLHDVISIVKSLSLK